MTRRALLALVIALVFAMPAVAQDDYMQLFGYVRPDRVQIVTATSGDNNQRVWTGASAQYTAQVAGAYWGWFTATDRIQPFSWDFKNWCARADFTPLMLMVAVREDWMQDGQLYQHYNTLSCYDVDDPALADCWQFQGSGDDMLMSSHRNSVQMTRDDIAALTALLFK